MLSEHRSLHCQHRSDDFPSMAEIIGAHRPLTVVELGTDEAGFAAWLADTVAPWGGRVTTFDIEQKFSPKAMQVPNLSFVKANVLGDAPCGLVVALIQQPRSLLYCDNGHKMTEISLYARFLPVGGLLATHDYGSEVDATWAEAFVAALGFAPEGHEKMEALRNEWYEPMTRFWLRREVLDPPASALPAIPAGRR